MWFHMCCALERTYKHWSYNTKLGLCQNYHSRCKLRRRSVQCTPQERMRRTWWSTQSNKPFWVEKTNPLAKSVSLMFGHLPQVETWMTEVENQMLAAIREAPHQRYINIDTISLYLVGDWRFYMILDVHELMVMSYDWCYVLLPGTVPQEIIIYN